MRRRLDACGVAAADLRTLLNVAAIHSSRLEMTVPDSARFALHRPEFFDSLMRGEEKIARLMSGSAAVHPAAGKTLIAANTDHHFVYRLKEGWAGRLRQLPDGRDQFILVFLPG